MIELASHETCTGCTACMNSCKHGAIEMKPDNEGFLFPSIDTAKCIECGLCQKRCPVLQSSESGNFDKPKAFALYSEEYRRVSSSGGAFSVFARWTFAKNGVVYGAAFDENLFCRHIKANTMDELSPIRGSKYVQSNIGNVFGEIRDALRQGTQVLFTGTPCQVAGLKEFLHKSYDNLLTLDLTCHGVPSNSVFQSYIERLSTRFTGKISFFEFRRRDGWGFAPSISFGGKLQPIYDVDNLYMCAFDRAALFRKSCYACPYAKLPRVGDCTIADFWGIGRYGKPFKHNLLKGVSLVLANNEKGLAAVNALQDSFIEERDLHEALIENYNITHPSAIYKDRDAIISAFLDKRLSLNDIDEKFHLVDKSLKGRIKKYATKYHVFDFVKAIYNKYKTL